MSKKHLSYVLNERMIAQRRILCTIIKDRGVSADWKDGRQTVAPSLISVSHRRRFRKTKGESLGEGNSNIFSLDFGSREERNALSARQSHIHIERIGFRGNEIGSRASSEKDFRFVCISIGFTAGCPYSTVKLIKNLMLRLDWVGT